MRPLERAKANETRCISSGSRCPPSYYDAFSRSLSFCYLASPHVCSLTVYDMCVHLFFFLPIVKSAVVDDNTFVHVST